MLVTFCFGATLDEGMKAYENGDYKMAWSIFSDLSYKGDAKATYGLGLMHYDGKGTYQSYTEALYWYQRASEQGFAEAQFSLGYMHEKGLGVEQNYKKAIEWYRKSGYQGVAKAQCSLGDIYHYGGKGVRQDYKKAKEWFGKACDNGFQIGCDEYKKLNQQGY